ncbi:MAG: MurR/RpiR family transcriptional regulator [Betaproteobacteria bacterium]
MKQMAVNSKDNRLTGCLIRIRGLHGLRGAQRMAGEFILAHPYEAVDLSVGELAAQAGVSPATVVRLCQVLGFKGYADFRAALAQDLAVQPRDIHAEISPQDPPPVIVDKVFQVSAQALRDTRAILEVEQLLRAADLIQGARRIDLYGAGGSGVVAQDMYHKLLTIGIFSHTSPDAHLQAMSASLLGPRDVALAISHSGATRETVEALATAKKAGAHTISVTNFSGSPITAVSDVVLLTASPETTTKGYATAARLAQLALLDALFMVVAFREFEVSLEGIRRTSRGVEEKQLR